MAELRGAAWTTATLYELERVLGWDAREADVLIGTSAGALAAALLGAGVSVARLHRRTTMYTGAHSLAPLSS